MYQSLEHGDRGGSFVSAREGGSGAGVQPAGHPTGGRPSYPETPGPAAGSRTAGRGAARAWRAAVWLADRTGWTTARDAHEVTRRALSIERLRTGRLLARIRLIGITLAFAVSWALPRCFSNAHEGSLQIFGVYWVVAASLCLA